MSLLINFDCKGEWRAFVEQKIKKDPVARVANSPLFVGGESEQGDEERAMQKGAGGRLQEGRRQ